MKKIIINENQEKKLIKEYLDKNYGMPLLKYLSISEMGKVHEIVNTFYYDFYTFLDKEAEADLYGISEEEYQEALKDSKIKIDNNNSDELIDNIINGKYKIFRNDFVNYAIKRHFYETETSPAWFYLEEPTLVPNEWLIHFSNNAYDIAKNGFSYGTANKERIAYSGAGDIKNKFGEGYDFAYSLTDYQNSYNNYDPLDRLSSADMKTSDKEEKENDVIMPKYGRDAVIFRASGVKAWHNGDREYQVIFWGPSAKDFIYLNNNNGDWSVYSIKTNKVLYHNKSLESIVNWVINNMTQYSKHIVDRSGNKRNRNYEENYN